MIPTLGLTPGIDRVRKPLDMYSPLPSQPWPGRDRQINGWIDVRQPHRQTDTHTQTDRLDIEGRDRWIC